MGLERGIIAMATWMGAGGFVVYKHARGSTAELENEERQTYTIASPSELLNVDGNRLGLVLRHVEQPLCW